ncbi:CYFA0S01e04456g1_1 [Cyberlindnera fabianii]|uniref:CYFA0S01e04456g1_1 n=1 Tax=Cyberlindnera fabianii TaxID=36022 RepID=A0A061AGU3_CYBFA|nr:CYFA0S01e04456g1_1 [Cyberlindnera fabianii]
MSRNAYSFRNRGGSEQPSEKRQKTVHSGSCVIYLGSVPKDWNEEIVRSVVAGSGDIVDIRVRIDPSGRSKNYVFVEYTTPSEARKAMDLLSQVTLGANRKFRVELSKEGLRTGHMDRPPLVLTRDHLPFYVNLPPEMSAAVPLPQQRSDEQQGAMSGTPQPQIAQPISAGTGTVKTEMPIPDVLARATHYLPAYNANAFTAEDKISQNLQGLDPPRLIELIATFKSIIAANPLAAQQALNLSPSIPIAATQALVLMGLIDPNVITAALQVATPKSNLVPTATPVTSYSNAPTPVTAAAQPQPDPRWPSLPAYLGAKLARLPPQEAATIAQVLQLSPEVISTLPAEQRQLVENIRRQYL